MIAYICLLIVDGLIVILILNLFDYINLRHGESFWIANLTIPFGYTYHKYKPMEFKDIIKKLIDYIKNKTLSLY